MNTALMPWLARPGALPAVARGALVVAFGLAVGFAALFLGLLDPPG